jgi:Ribonuclease G/E
VSTVRAIANGMFWMTRSRTQTTFLEVGVETVNLCNG